MKIRNGFVSNSSSSSFILNGVKITIEESSNLFSEDDYYSFGKENDLTIEQDRYYFGGDLEGYIIGVSNTNFNDGEVTMIKNISEDDKQKIIEKLKLIGIKKTTDDVNTFVQFVSNDNY